MHTYAPADVTFTHGTGSYLFDKSGRKYLDFLSGISVTSLGHAHPVVTEAISRQAARVTHVSNLFGNEHAGTLAENINRLISLAACRVGEEGVSGRVFFSNSGAEAIECAIKLTRKRASQALAESTKIILGIEKGFHGRTHGALAATGQPDKKVGFDPLPGGFDHVELNNLEALDARYLSADSPGVVQGVIFEPVLGESGVLGVDSSFARALVEVARSSRGVVIVDEIQTGLGRTGDWFGFERLGVVPDIITLAKSLGNGFPIGACWARDEVADYFVPGSHGSTFGGQPLACSAALATLGVIEQENLIENARYIGAYLSKEISSLAQVVEVRGFGLLIGITLCEETSARAVQTKALEAGLIINAIGDSIIRLAPPLNVSIEEANQAVEVLGSALSA